MELTTKELASKFKVKASSIHYMYWVKGHYRGWEPCGNVQGGGYLWRYVGEFE